MTTVKTSNHFELRVFIVSLCSSDAWTISGPGDSQRWQSWHPRQSNKGGPQKRIFPPRRFTAWGQMEQLSWLVWITNKNKVDIYCLKTKSWYKKCFVLKQGEWMGWPSSYRIPSHGWCQLHVPHNASPCAVRTLHPQWLILTPSGTFYSSYTCTSGVAACSRPG